MGYKPTKWENIVYDEKGTILKDGTILKAEYLNNIEGGILELFERDKNTVYKENGKGLSANDFSNFYKEILDGLEKVYSSKNMANGLVILDDKGKIPHAAIPSQFKSNTVVKSKEEMESLDEIFEGLRVLVVDETGKTWEEYMYDGEKFIQLSTSQDTEIDLAWDMITGRPETFKPTAHTHTESDITGLDKYSKQEIDNKLKGKSSLNHTHSVSDLEDLDTLTTKEIDERLKGKSDLHHKHEVEDIVQGGKSFKEVVDSEIIELDNKISLQDHNTKEEFKKYLKEENLPNHKTLKKVVDLGNHEQIDLDKIYTHRHNYKEIEGKPKIPVSITDLKDNVNLVTSDSPKRILISESSPTNAKEGDIWIRI